MSGVSDGAGALSTATLFFRILRGGVGSERPPAAVSRQQELSWLAVVFNVAQRRLRVADADRIAG